MTVETYERVETAAAYRTGIVAADLVTLNALPAVPELNVAGAPTLEITGRANAAGETLLIHVVRYTRDAAGDLVYRSTTERTLTSTSSGVTVAAAGQNVPTLAATYVDSGSAEVIKVRAALPSGGSTWDLWVVPVGPRRN